jgi:hypothetical protein
MSNWNRNPFGCDGGNQYKRVETSSEVSTTAKTERELEIVKFADLLPRLDTRPLIKGYLDREQTSLLVGDPACGKTFLAVDRDLHVAANRDWFGHKVNGGPVIYIATEAGRSIANRVAAWRQAREINGQDLPFAVITSPVDLCHADSGDLDRVVEAVKRTGLTPLTMLDVDTVSRAMAGGNENSPDDMGAYVNTTDRLRDKLHCHVGNVHHFGKDASRGARGHNLMFCAVDVEAQVARDCNTGVSVVKITKQRDGVAGTEFGFRLHQITLGLDQDGDPVTSCVVDPVWNGAAEQKPPPKHKKLTPKQQIALDALKRGLTAEPMRAPAGNDIPPQVMVIPVETWRKFYLASTSANDQSENTRRKAFREAMEVLISEHIVRIFNELAWLC